MGRPPRALRIAVFGIVGRKVSGVGQISQSRQQLSHTNLAVRRWVREIVCLGELLETAEEFLDAGNTIINVGEYIFYMPSEGNSNAANGIKNILNVPAADMSGQKGRLLSQQQTPRKTLQPSRSIRSTVRALSMLRTMRERPGNLS